MVNEELKMNNLQKLNVIIGIIIVIFLALIINGQVLFSQDFHEVGLSYANEINHKYDNYNVIDTRIQSIDNQILSITVSKETPLLISLYDANGNFIKLLLYDNIPAGKYEYDLKNQIPQGNYVCKINSGDITETLDFIIQ